MIVAVIRYKTKATARRTLTFIVRIFVNNTIAIAVWTSFHLCVHRSRALCELILGGMGTMRANRSQLGGFKALPVPFGSSSHRLGGVYEPVWLSLADIAQQVDSLIKFCEVQIGRFPTHVLED